MAYAHDALDRLVEARPAAGPATTYAYGPEGDRVRVEVDGVATVARHDADSALVELGGLPVAVDALGRRVARGDQRYAWDAASRLVSAGPAADPVTYRYDARGWLLGRDDERCLTAPGPFGPLPLCLMTYGDDGVHDAYVFDPLGVSSRHGAADRYPLRGLHGSIMALTDAGGAVGARYRYDPWGAPVGEAPAEPFLYGYAGELTDAATGLIWLRSRWYDPTTASFLSADAAPALSEDPRSLNRYAYTVQGSPLDHTDRTGAFTLVEINITTGIQQTLNGIRGALLYCAREAAQGAVIDAVFEGLKEVILQAVFGGLAGAFDGFIDAVIGGQNIEGHLRRFFCGAQSVLPAPGGDVVRFEVVVDRCGEPEGTGDVSCPGPLPGQNFPPAPDPEGVGTALDVVISNTLPIELKSHGAFKPAQMTKYCRYASRTGGHVVVGVFGDWPPCQQGAGRQGECAAGNSRRHRLEMLEQCIFCWRDHDGASNKGCGGRTIGSAMIYVGYDRQKRRLRAEAPRISDLKRLCKPR
ncbi:MAG: RHS repeat-associated core domain-containing protein [bacterium]